MAETVDAWRRWTPHALGRGEVLDRVGLGHRAAVRVGQLSGGEKRRLDLALAVLGRPEVLFLHEPTTGLDPEARRKVWELVRGMVADGATVLLTTHYLDEAEQLAQRLAIMHDGRIVTEGTLAGVLGERGTRISFRLPGARPGDLPYSPGLARRSVRQDGETFTVETHEPQRGLAFTILLLPLFIAFVHTSGPTASGEVNGVPAAALAAIGAIAVVFPFSYMTIATGIVVRREERVYKRLRGGALSTTAIFAGDILHATLVGAVQAAVILVYAVGVVGVPVPGNVPLMLVAFVLGAAVFAALAIGTAGLIPNYEVAQLVALPVLFASMLGAGMMFPLSVLPEWGQRVAEVLPMTPVVDMMRIAFLVRDLGRAGAPEVGFLVSAAGLGIGLLWIGVGLWCTRKFFRWDPRRA
ncbi:ABC transporter ATP-binding protein/permease [Nonomuraea harbinensis]|uniref:ABC transporter permease n=1 Tax=Nonomuraea harbinensis TaxID=1286938 RepID=A0ABW1BUG1_9ACTN|nr:ABC transporter ATP-binding protein/permease [Nonomuraea harbinensis]